MSDNARPTWQPKLLVGRKEIADYIGVSIPTLDRYIRHRGFPGCPLPNNHIVTSVFLVDAWLMARKDQYRQLLDKQHEELLSDETPERKDDDQKD